MSGCVKIYDLNNGSNQTKPFITIPLIESNVKQLIHSNVGNYLAIFGINQNQTNSKTVRVYCNYWIEGQPIRIRPFGSLDFNSDHNQYDYNIRETITSEVIEFNEPFIETEAQYIACCESSANLAVCCGFRVLFYCFQTFHSINNILKTDFVFLMDIKLHWFATRLAFVENKIALMSKTHCSLLSINFDYDEQNGLNIESNDPKVNQSQTLDNKCIEWDFEDKSKTIRLPSMFGQQVRDNVMIHSEQVFGPVDQSLSCKFALNMNHSFIESSICRASIEVLFCQYFLSGNQIIDIDLISYYKIKHLSSDPLNVSSLNSSQTKTTKNMNPFTSKTSDDLIRNALIVLTEFNFYIYDILKSFELIQKIELNERVKSFSMNKIDDTLHVITDKGLKTYGINFLPLFLDYKKCVPVLNLNFRTFLNVDFLLNTKNYLVLVTQTDNNNRTIYSLKKPSLRELSSDINYFINDNSLKLEDQFNLISYLNAVLNFSFNFNAQNDSQIISCYQKCCVNLSNILIDINYNQEFALNLINSAKLTFFHLITLNLNYKLIFEFIRIKLESNETLNINECELSSLKNFLKALYIEDFVLFCRFSLNQFLEYDIRLIIIELIRETQMSKMPYLCRITLSKLLFDNNQINESTDILLSLDLMLATIVLYQNYKFIFLHNSFVIFFEKCSPYLFYSFLLVLVNNKNSVNSVYKMLENFEILIRHNFLNKAYNQYSSLFDSHLMVELIVANVKLLCNDKNDLCYKPIESIDKKIVFWMELLPPYHTQNQCFCTKCNKITCELYLLLYSSINEDIVKNEVNNILNSIDQNYEWLFTARLLSMNTIEAIELLLNDFPPIVFPFISDVCDSNTNVLKQIIHLLDSRVDNINEMDINSDIGITLNHTLNRLALMLSPEELITLLPLSWKQFAITYVEKCIINSQAKKLKEKIINLGLEIKTMLST
jgi:hypothetical protein